MKYGCTLLAVSDLRKSLRFYRQVLGLSVTADFGANVTLEGGLSLQTMDTWREFIGGKEITLHSNACEVYFEESDMDGFLNRLKNAEVEYVHPPLEHSWGQRVVRFYDPDHHIIEVGEEMGTVVRRFADSGMTPEQIAIRMDVPPDYVKQHLTED